MSQVAADRVQAAQALGVLADGPALEHLGLLLTSDRDPAVRAAAARAFAQTGDPLYQALLASVAASDPDAGVRAAAAAASQRLWAAGLRPRWAAGLSLLCPGCGYFHLGQPGRAAAYIGTTVALVGAAVVLASANGLPSLDSEGLGPRMTPSVGPLALPTLMAAQNLWFYGIFASYRDARLLRGDQGYRYPVSPESLTDLLTAPVRPSVLRRPWFWLGLPLALGAAAGFSALVSPGDFSGHMRSLGDGGGVWFLGRHYGTGPGVALASSYNASLFLPVGVGEEALFRGTIQAGLSEELGLWPGWVVASLIFGGVHFFNFVDQPGGLATGAKAVPFLTAVGAYFGLVSIETGHTLATNVALHTWYDFLLSTLSFVADPDHQPFSLRIGMPF